MTGPTAPSDQKLMSPAPASLRQMTWLPVPVSLPNQVSLLELVSRIPQISRVIELSEVNGL